MLRLKDGWGICTGGGQGVPFSREIAFKWYMKAAEQGYAPAQKDVPMYYEDGRGVADNDQKAVWWLIKSAEQGYDWGQFKLARLYQDGECVITNYIRAYMWYELSLYTNPKSDFAFHAKELKQLTAQKMTKAGISEAQKMASRCLASHYTDC